LPYFLKTKGKNEGTYIRVSSSSRQADIEIIAELERQKRNISFDDELVFDIPWDSLQLSDFGNIFKEKTGEDLNQTALKKLGLLKEYQGNLLPTNALVLFANEDSKKSHFPYAKIECARFKGTTPSVFIDKKSFVGSIATQAELAY
jgi:ATP-dependent DNA helicase RecG